MEFVCAAWAGVLKSVRRLGPYVLLEAIMPGGTLLALLLYLYRARGAAR